MTTIKEISLLSPAKVNLFLRITGTLENGYHSLEMVNAKISLQDILTCRLVDDSGIVLTVSDPSIPSDETNTVYKAARRFLQRTGLLFGVEMDLQKKIPHGAGLGGGSSNAATVLLALNELSGFPLPLEDLMNIGASIGADVPFFMGEGCSFVQGIGELVSPVKIHSSLLENTLYLVLCSPAIHVSTKEAYSLWDQNGMPESSKPEDLLACLQNGNRNDISDCLYNSFESVIYPNYPDLKKAWQTFCSISPTKPLLSGSGSNMFSIHTDVSAAEMVNKEMLAQGYKTQICRLLL